MIDIKLEITMNTYIVSQDLSLQLEDQCSQSECAYRILSRTWGISQLC